MELHARLVHAEAGLRVVEVRASRGEHSLGSSLAEAATAQEAEDLAVARLLRRLGEPGFAAPSDGQPPAAASPIKQVAPPQAEHASRPSRAGAVAPLSLPASGAAGKPAASPAVAASPAMRAPNRPQQQPNQPAGAAAHSPGVQNSSAAGTAAEQPQLASGMAGAPADGASLDRRPAESTAEPLQLTTAPAAPPDKTGVRPEPTEDIAALPQSDPQEEPPADPEDWSQELTAVDLQLRRLGWNREQEGLYLQRAFGHPSRSRLTRYSDLRAYLMALEGLEPGCDPAGAAVPLRRSELLAQGDALLRQLGWSAEQGRAFLERQLARLSRQQLSDVQLLQFNMLLEGELLAIDAATATTAPEGAQR